jgi:hypothetical protein
MADLVEKGQALAVDDDPIELVATATESGAVTLRGQPVDVFGEMDRQGRGTRAMAIGGTILLAGIGVTASWALS